MKSLLDKMISSFIYVLIKNCLSFLFGLKFKDKIHTPTNALVLFYVSKGGKKRRGNCQRLLDRSIFQVALVHDDGQVPFLFAL